MLLMNFFIQSDKHIEFSFGPHYSSYLLYQDDEDANGKLNLGGEIGIANFIPNIGLKIRGSILKYKKDAYTYEYMPLTLCTSLNLLPFVKLKWLKLSMETGLGLYLWKGLENDEVIVLSSGDKMDEKDIGFVGGLTLQLRPIRFIGLEFSSRYNYIASSDIYKYGFDDKDEKIWENGVGLKIIIP